MFTGGITSMPASPSKFPDHVSCSPALTHTDSHKCVCKGCEGGCRAHLERGRRTPMVVKGQGGHLSAGGLDTTWRRMPFPER